MDNDRKHDAYRLLNSFGFSTVFLTTQPESGTETFVLGPDVGIPSIELNGNQLLFYDKPLSHVLKFTKPFLGLDVTNKYSTQSLEKFAKRINENLWFNKTSKLKITIDSPHENLFYASSLFFKKSGKMYPQLTFGRLGCNPMYFLDNEYKSFKDYFEEFGFDVEIVQYGIDSEFIEYN